MHAFRGPAFFSISTPFFWLIKLGGSSLSLCIDFFAETMAVLKQQTSTTKVTSNMYVILHLKSSVPRMISSSPNFQPGNPFPRFTDVGELPYFFSTDLT